MVNWSDPALIAKQGSAFDKILLFVLGLYVYVQLPASFLRRAHQPSRLRSWEFVVTFREFEGQFLRKGRKPTVKWHHVRELIPAARGMLPPRHVLHTTPGLTSYRVSRDAISYVATPSSWP